MFRGKGWFSGGLWKPKNPHSLDHLKYLYHLLSKNQVVTEQNKELLVETLRSIAEILIWGDQNDSTVFDFFLEKNMLSFFLKIMKQKCGRYVCVQLLQTLNILFENIRNETSLYYLLSNNHVNSIIVHKFDFSDEEVMAYYISFLKTLSLKLNGHTIHFFYNEHTNDFPLYTEGIKFFNHSESMVRIAVRTLTLNVFKVDDKAMLKFIRDKTAAPYFSNLVWFIGNHVLELDTCVRNNGEAQSQNRLADLVAEHLDHLHYLNDILYLQIDALNEVLTDHLLNRLLVPLYVYSLTKRRRHSQIEDDRPHVSSIVSLFLLSQVFLIVCHQPLVRQLAHIILNRDMSVFSTRPRDDSAGGKRESSTEPEFVPPEVSLEKSLETRIQPECQLVQSQRVNICMREGAESIANEFPVEVTTHFTKDSDILAQALLHNVPITADTPGTMSGDVYKQVTTNITDEEKVVAARKLSQTALEQLQQEFCLSERPFLESIFNALECTENDHAALFALCLLFALGHNQGINQDLLDSILMPTDKSETKHWYNVSLVERLIKIINLSCQYNSRVRLATLQMSLQLLKQLVLKDGRSFLQDRHLAAIEQSREESSLLLRNFYKSEEIFLDMFEDEYQEMKKKPLNVEYLMMDANLLLPPSGTPMSGVEFHKRLPCGEVERARRSIRVFFLLRDLSLTLRTENETQLPLTNIASCIKVSDTLDLNNSDLIACTVVTKDSQKIRRFMVIDILQLILVEPDNKRLGWGVAKFVGFLQDIEVSGDKDDSRCLHITVHRPASSVSVAVGDHRTPLLAARFVFDDHIRCMAAKQRLTKGRLKARQRKMHQIARLLDLPDHIQPCPSPLRHSLHATHETETMSRRTGSGMQRSLSQDTGLRGRPFSSGPGLYRPLFVTMNKVPGFATALRREQVPPPAPSAVAAEDCSTDRQRHSSGSPSMGRRHSRSSSKSRDSSPRLHGSRYSEEIPLEVIPRCRGLRHASPRLRHRSSGGLPKTTLSPGRTIPHETHSSPVLSLPRNAAIGFCSDDRRASNLDIDHVPNDLPPLHFSVHPDKCCTNGNPAALRMSAQGLHHADALPVSLLSNDRSYSIAAAVRIALPTNLFAEDRNCNGEAMDNDMESPPAVCTKPCCMSETSFVEEREQDLEANLRTCGEDHLGGPESADKCQNTLHGSSSACPDSMQNTQHSSSNLGVTQLHGEKTSRVRGAIQTV